VPKIPTRQQVSSGGVAFREQRPEVEVVLIAVYSARGLRWQLPKGLVEEGETPEATAVREVREETGIATEPVQQIERIEYWYYGTEGSERVRYHKFVHFFLLRYVSGDVADHDREVTEARWVGLADAKAMLAFASERRIMERAESLIASARSA
jgi:8-oxo-dGTP pyrophosphatase MutT (NUDIX family)